MPRYPSLSRTTAGLSDRVFAVLLPRIQAHQGKLHALHVGDTYLNPPEAAQSEKVRMAEHSRMHTYAPPQGMPVLLEAIQARLKRRFGVEVPQESLQVTLGATGGINLVCHSLLDLGDEVLLPTPYWPLVRGIIQHAGAVPIQIPFYTRLNEDGFDPEQVLEAAITEKTTAIYINTPNNPTGAILTDSHLAAIARVAERHDLWIITDEVYEDLYFGDEPPPCAWLRPDMAHRTIVTHSLSKAYGLAGARLGYTHGPAEIMHTLRGVQTFMTYCAAKPMQLAGAKALETGDSWLEATRSKYRDAACWAADLLQVPAPPGGTFVFFDASRWLGPGENAIPLLERCIDAGVILVPGVASGAGYDRWVRLCFTSVPPEDLKDALQRLKGVLNL